MALCKDDEVCAVEHFSGVGHDEQTFFKTWYGCSPEFLPMKGPMKLQDFKRLVKTFVKWQHEFTLTIGNVKIERGITGGIVFTAAPTSMLRLIEKLNIPNEYLLSSYAYKLMSISKTGKIRFEGEFNQVDVLFSYIYDELMLKINPDYFKFMDALESATFA